MDSMQTRMKLNRVIAGVTEAGDEPVLKVGQYSPVRSTGSSSFYSMEYDHDFFFHTGTSLKLLELCSVLSISGSVGVIHDS